MTLKSALAWRYATKKFDPTKKIPDKLLHDVLESLRLSPSSFGLQPWRFVVVQNPKTKQALRSVSYDQPQVEDCSHLIVLCARTDIDESYVKRFVDEIAKSRNVSRDAMKSYEDMMLGSIMGRSDQERLEWAQKQVYISLGFLLLAAAQSKIDACPMEGFDNEGVDNILQLKEKGLRSTVICALGYRAKDDPAASRPKVRWPADEVFTVV